MEGPEPESRPGFRTGIPPARALRGAVAHWGYDGLAMLKIENVKWHGKCQKHPMFDPESDGIGAIRGGCLRCQELQAIFVSHQRTLQLMRDFGPISSARKEPADPGPDRQQDLFSFLL